ncbi:ribonuclease H1 domain-containing protein [Siansivirga zeaxanthinifaciens]|uniref:Ribonuclease H n=1 Tax=Siansivirga zeaxanthinifaciens CC-SAMT-1 TaxID=1454006 RepID=A0A0C5WAM3_9FLAO|nr:ribonuclease H family protein [Siansivirga zeaxanthinifaciens]AJR03362.1 ribonuclease H [Siansivirga zeaxanthinifaciens CC-SAMT-1]
MAKPKYYVVWEGRKKGILESWAECTESTHGYKGAKYKSFKTRELAEKAYSESYEDYKGKTIFETELSDDELKKIGKPNLNSISVDAACNMQNGLMEYQGVDTKTRKAIFRQGPHKGASNNIGEFLALVHAVALMKKKGDKRPIYTDSTTAISWVNRKECGTYTDKTEENKQVFDLISRAETWLNNNEIENKILKWETKAWGEIPADYGRK